MKQITLFSPLALFTFFVFVSFLGEPVLEITQFDAEKQASKILLTWETKNEIHTHHFVVQRSSDRKNWENRLRKHALAEPGTGRAYELLDLLPPDSGAYYRIKQVDRQGTSLFYPEVVYVGPKPEITLSPDG